MGIANKLCADDSGQFGIFFAIITMVLMAGIGAAIDSNHYSNQKTRAQAALDAATLAVATEELNTGLGSASQDVKKFLDTNFEPRLASTLTKIKPRITVQGHFGVTARLRVEPVLGQIFGIENYESDIETVVNLPNLNRYTDVNVAIAWDASTSMTSLLPNVKTAADALYDELVTQDYDGEFSVFPYSQYDSNRNFSTQMSEMDLKLDGWKIDDFITNMAIMTSGPAHTDGGAACGWETIEQANATIETVNPDDLNVVFFMHDGDGFCGADDKILEQCQIIRDRGIIMISVRFGGYSTKEQLFLDCVGGDTSKYFYVNSAETAVQAFLDGTFGTTEQKYIVR